MKNELVVVDHQTPVPAAIAAAGAPARQRFVEFFTANIRNRNTRAAYARAVGDFFAWCEQAGLSTLESVQPVHVAAYIEQLCQTRSAPSVKQHLAAIRMLFDWLVVGQVVPSNPASVVRGPKHVVKRGKTPVLSPEEARELFSSIPTDTLVGLRDRALIGVLIYSFARVSAAVAMRIEDYFPQGKRWWLGFTRKAASTTKCPCTTPSRSIWTPTLRRPAFGRTRRARCFGLQIVKRVSSRRTPSTGRTPSTLSGWVRQRTGSRRK